MAGGNDDCLSRRLAYEKIKKAIFWLGGIVFLFIDRYNKNRRHLDEEYERGNHRQIGEALGY